MQDLPVMREQSLALKFDEKRVYVRGTATSQLGRTTLQSVLDIAPKASIFFIGISL